MYRYNTIQSTTLSPSCHQSFLYTCLPPFLSSCFLDNTYDNTISRLIRMIEHSIFYENPMDIWLSIYYVLFVGRSGALVETMTFNRRVVGSTPALAATWGSWASPLSVVACALRVKLRYSIRAVVGSASEQYKT